MLMAQRRHLSLPLLPRQADVPWQNPIGIRCDCRKFSEEIVTKQMKMSCRYLEPQSTVQSCAALATGPAVSQLVSSSSSSSSSAQTCEYHRMDRWFIGRMDGSMMSEGKKKERKKINYQHVCMHVTVWCVGDEQRSSARDFFRHSNFNSPYTLAVAARKCASSAMWCHM
jgi:hypothetical protein